MRKWFQILGLLLLLGGRVQGDDPYEWLEEDQSEETLRWEQIQRQATGGYLAHLPERGNFERRLTEICQTVTYSLPIRYGDSLFFLKKGGKHDRAVLVEKAGEEERVLIDPNNWNRGDCIEEFTISPDGRLLAYKVAIAGSDKSFWHLFDLETKEALADQVDGSLFTSVAFDQEGARIYYFRQNKGLYEHLIGGEKGEDLLLYQVGEDRALTNLVMSKESLLFMEKEALHKGHKVLRLNLKTEELSTLVEPGDFSISFVGQIEDTLYFLTDREANFSQVISFNLDNPEVWTPLIQEEGKVLESVCLANNKFVCTFYQDALGKVRLYDLEGNFLRDIPLPGRGSVTCRATKESAWLDLLYTDFLTPPTLYAVNIESGKHKIRYSPPLSWERGDFSVEQVWITSYDGTELPVFLLTKKGGEIDESTPLLLYGYGGFQISITPFFASYHIAWLERGGVIAIPNLRGGKEYGKRWHQEGSVENKQNVFHDALATVEWLHENRIGSPSTTGIFGTSNGGLMAGACLTQRPDLFGAAVVNKGVLDLLRFPHYTVGKYWIPEYGNPESDEDGEILLSYSPYHKVEEGVCYPPTLVNTADHDDRVVPMHSRKFAAALQEKSKGPGAILFRIEEDCGHGTRASQSQEIFFGKDLLAFLFANLTRCEKTGG
ncbi:MAG: Prolyl endopeptidase [Chlamydiae bacterium]|nr:Prolyl endopeptidase [Chlamydiota bacterium]